MPGSPPDFGMTGTKTWHASAGLSDHTDGKQAKINDAAKKQTALKHFTFRNSKLRWMNLNSQKIKSPIPIVKPEIRQRRT